MILEHYFTNNTSLKSELRWIPYQYQDYVFSFVSDNGVFSKNKIDYGSKLLVETILESKEKIKNILDVGCGYGFIGIVLAKVKESQALLVDVNKRAIHLAKKNGKNNKVDIQVLESNCYEKVEGLFDIIVTNPPIHAGKETVYSILINAQEYLKKDGTLWFVIRKDEGAKSIEKRLKEIYQLEIVKKDKGFYIFKAKKIDTTCNC